MGAALTQHPALYRAVVSHVGIYDMLRFERFPNGVFNVTECGSIREPILLVAATGRGHGVTALSQVIDEQTDVFAFLLHELGG